MLRSTKAPPVAGKHKAREQPPRRAAAAAAAMSKAAGDQAGLYRAAELGDVDKTGALLEAGVDANLADSKGRRPIHFAACGGHAAVISELIRYGAEINVVDCNGNTPLHLAVISNWFECVTLLLHAGAVIARDNNNKTPLDAARGRLRILRARGNVDGPIDDRFDREISQILDMLVAYASAEVAPDSIEPSAEAAASSSAKQLQQLQLDFASVSFQGSKLDVLQDALDKLAI